MLCINSNSAISNIAIFFWTLVCPIRGPNVNVDPHLHSSYNVSNIAESERNKIRLTAILYLLQFLLEFREGHSKAAAFSTLGQTFTVARYEITVSLIFFFPS